MHYVYVLQLERPNTENDDYTGGECYYVGRSADLLHRLAAHKKGTGAAATRRSGVKELCAVYTMPDLATADRLEKYLAREFANHKINGNYLDIPY